MRSHGAAEKKLSTTAVAAAAALPIGLFLVLVASLAALAELPLLKTITLFLAALTPAAACALGIASLTLCRRSRGATSGRGWDSAALTVGAIVLSVQVLAVPIMNSTFKGVECWNNVEALIISLQMYARDYEVLPPADTWCDALVPYVKRRGAFVCPERRDLRCGYAFNSALGGVRFGSIKNPEYVIGVLESDAGWNAHGGKELLPRTPRHRGTDRYGLIGGEMNTDHPEVRVLPREAVMDGVAGIFWHPQAKRP